MTTVAAPPARKRRVWPWILGALGALLVVFIALFAWDGVRLQGAAGDLEAHASAAQDAVTARDADALVTEVADLQKAAGEFAAHTSGPHWVVASWIPWVSDQVRPLMQAGESVEAVSLYALGPLSEMDDLSALEAPPIENGRIDPYVLEPYRETLADAAAVMSEQRAALAEIDPSGAVNMVRESYLTLESQMATLGDLIQGAHVTAELLPPMLGAEGERTYLVMVQNNAEPRTTGGIPGAVLKVTANDGRIALVGYAAAGSMVNRDGIDFELTDDELRLFTERMIIYPQDVNFTPEYPRSAAIMSAFWEDSHGETVDGVLSVDPVALGYMLQGMQPTEIAGVTVTADNLAEVMLHDSYELFPDPEDSDAFFALAASSLFGQMLSGGVDVVGGVERSIEDNRFMLWSALGDEQALLETTTVAGEFLEQADALGIFINDGSGSKIGYYISNETTVTDRLCRAGDVGAQTVDIVLTHTFTGDPDDLPEYVSGGDFYVPSGEFHANVIVYPQEGLGVTSVTFDGEPGQLFPSTHEGRPFTSTRVVLKPGESVTLTFELLASERGLASPRLVETPASAPMQATRAIDSSSLDC